MNATGGRAGASGGRDPSGGHRAAIVAGRDRRAAAVAVGEARGQIDAAIRACLDAQATIMGQPAAGGTS